jgi:hypothetical protein
MERRFPLETDSGSSCQVTSFPFYEQKTHCYVPISPPVDTVLSQINRLHALRP